MSGSVEHRYEVAMRWTGNLGEGTAGYHVYARDHEVAAPGKPVLLGSSDPAFRGDGARWNPEELLVAALSQCHLLAYLHVCASAGVVVTGYDDQASGTMVTDERGTGRFTEVVLRPRVTVRDVDMREVAQQLHDTAHQHCFIASSVSFPVRHEPSATVGSAEPI